MVKYVDISKLVEIFMRTVDNDFLNLRRDFMASMHEYNNNIANIQKEGFAKLNKSISNFILLLYHIEENKGGDFLK